MQILINNLLINFAVQSNQLQHSQHLYNINKTSFYYSYLYSTPE